MRITRIITGLLVWVGVFAGLLWTLNTQIMSQGSVASNLVPSLFSYSTGSRTYADLKMDQSVRTAVGDPIFFIRDDLTFQQVGEIVRIGEGPGETGTAAIIGIYTRDAQAMFYPDRIAVPPGSTLSFYETEDSIAWMLKTLIPPDKRAIITQEINDAIAANREEILAALLPIVNDTLQEALLVVQDELPKSIARHAPELEKLGSKYQVQIIEKKLTPLVKEEIWPIARKKAMPVANKIGSKIWERVSVGKFAVQYMWDLNPFGSGKNLEKSWNEFLDKEAMPILESHTEEIIAMLQEVVAEASKNEKVRAVFGESAKQVLADSELHAVVWTVLKETIIQNPKLHAVLVKHWTSDRAKAAIQLAGQRMEPLVVKIGDTIFGTEETGGISPQLARVMRYRLLQKDTRWYVVNLPVHAANAADAEDGPLVLPVKRASDPVVHPFVGGR
ncbi:MAG: hypothetical protein WD768_12635 [Phycisphaeraceae bacterium]